MLWWFVCLFFRLRGKICTVLVHFCPKRGRDENRMAGMERQGSVMVRKIW